MQVIPWRNRFMVRNPQSVATNPVTSMWEMDQLFDRLMRNPFGPNEAWLGLSNQGEFMPAPIDVKDTPESFCVRVDLPGVDPKAVELSVSNGVLTISGERKEEREEKENGWQHLERRVGQFQRTIQLPEDVDADKAQAEHKHGVLSVTFPKVAAAKPRRIEVKSH